MRGRTRRNKSSYEDEGNLKKKTMEARTSRQKIIEMTNRQGRKTSRGGKREKLQINWKNTKKKKYY